MLQNETKTMREIHTIRADNYERTKDLSPGERSRLRSESAQPVAKQYGFRIVPIRKSV